MERHFCDLCSNEGKLKEISGYLSLSLFDKEKEKDLIDVEICEKHKKKILALLKKKK